MDIFNNSRINANVDNSFTRNNYTKMTQKNDILSTDINTNPDLSHELEDSWHSPRIQKGDHGHRVLRIRRTVLKRSVKNI